MAFRFRLLKTGPDDRTPLYGRPFKCKACGSRKVVLYAIDDQAELDAIPGRPNGRELVRFADDG